MVPSLAYFVPHTQTTGDKQGRVLTPHEDGGVGIQGLSKHGVLRLKPQQRQQAKQS